LWSLRVFWDVAPCSHVEVDRRFIGEYCLHHQGDENLKSHNTPLSQTFRFYFTQLALTASVPVVKSYVPCLHLKFLICFASLLNLEPLSTGYITSLLLSQVVYTVSVNITEAIFINMISFQYITLSTLLLNTSCLWLAWLPPSKYFAALLNSFRGVQVLQLKQCCWLVKNQSRCNSALPLLYLWIPR
jgi:hypothetical protein